MTPGEIADWLEDHGKRHTPWCDRYAQAAATIRAQAEALKIATEALAWVDQCYGHEMSEDMVAHIAQALARIKEVG